MGWDGMCKVCPKKCSWERHINSHIHYKSMEITETVVLEDVRAKYQNSKQTLETSTTLIISNVDELIDNCNRLVMHHQRI